MGAEQSATAAIGPDGRFAFLLSVGTWDITADAGMSCDTVRVEVAAGDGQAFGAITVSCDTGIR